MLPLLLLACGNASVDDGARLNALTQHDDGFASFFSLEAEDGVILFDAGNSKDALVEVVDGRDVLGVFLSHGHGDHLGGLAETPAPVLALAAEEDLLTEEGVTLDQPLEEGLVTLGGWTIEVFAVTGHTEGHAVYLVDGVLLMEDTVVVDKDGSLKRLPNFFYDDPDESDASVVALAELLASRVDELAIIAASHSGPTTDIDALFTYGIDAP